MTNLYTTPLLICCQNKALWSHNTIRASYEKNIVYISNLNNKCVLPNCFGNRPFHLGFHIRRHLQDQNRIVGNFKRFSFNDTTDYQTRLWHRRKILCRNRRQFITMLTSCLAWDYETPLEHVCCKHLAFVFHFVQLCEVSKFETRFVYKWTYTNTKTLLKKHQICWHFKLTLDVKVIM